MGILDDIKARGDAWAEGRMGEQANIPLKNITYHLTHNDAEKAALTKEYRQFLLSMGRNPDVPFVHEDVVEPVVEKVQEVVEAVTDKLDVVGNTWDTIKWPLALGGVVIGGALLLGYSGMGKPIGAGIARKIEKGDE